MSTAEDSFGGGFSLGFWGCLVVFFIAWLISWADIPTKDINGKYYITTHWCTYELTSPQPVSKEVIIVKQEDKCLP